MYMYLSFEEVSLSTTILSFFPWCDVFLNVREMF